MNTDCFAFIGKHKNPPCSCLEELVCDGKKCSFYKTKKQFNIDLAAIHGTTSLKDISKLRVS